MTSFNSTEAVATALQGAGYVSEPPLAMAVYLALQLGKPILLEGPPGVGKTQLAHSLSEIIGGDFIRLQCFEGIDASTALYEWNYAKQMAALRMHSEQKGSQLKDVFDESFLLERPLLKALRSKSVSPVLLIDEVDRADEEFEAFLLEFLDRFQISIPEIGTIEANVAPTVILTSNRTRPLHDALRRRCLYHWIDYPDLARETEILVSRVPAIEAELAANIAGFMHLLRNAELVKPPGIAEAIDWARCLSLLGIVELTPDVVGTTVSTFIKNHSDLRKISGAMIEELLNSQHNALRT